MIVKVGSSVLTDGAGRLLPERLELLAGQIATAVRDHRQLVVVSSGAIACGMAALGLARRPKETDRLQACAAIGQSELMGLYVEAFRRRGATVAQVLLTEDDLADARRRANATRTLVALIEQGVIPVVNENDTVASDAKTFGDNDRLAALLAAAVDARLLVVLSDVDGLLEDGQVVDRVEEVTEAHSALIRDGLGGRTKGGMSSKLDAARIAGRNGIPMVIANGTRPGVLEDVLAGRPVGTWFVPPENPLRPSKWWIAFSRQKPEGEVVVDAGAAQALVTGDRSLLAAGVREARGRFEAGAFVAIVDESGVELARGISNVSSSELLRVRGMRSDAAARALGRELRGVVHKSRLVLSREVRP